MWGFLFVSSTFSSSSIDLAVLFKTPPHCSTSPFPRSCCLRWSCLSGGPCPCIVALSLAAGQCILFYIGPPYQTPQIFLNYCNFFFFFFSVSLLHLASDFTNVNFLRVSPLLAKINKWIAFGENPIKTVSLGLMILTS